MLVQINHLRASVNRLSLIDFKLLLDRFENMIEVLVRLLRLLQLIVEYVVSLSAWLLRRRVLVDGGLKFGNIQVFLRDYFHVLIDLRNLRKEILRS